MFELLEFVMVAVLFTDLAVRRSAEVVAWVKKAETTVVDEVKKL